MGIPHHQNAMNMAKALLKTGKVDCPDIGEESSSCDLKNILLSIVAGQNHQIQVMRGILEENQWPDTDACTIPAESAASTISGAQTILLPLLVLVASCITI